MQLIKYIKYIKKKEKRTKNMIKMIEQLTGKKITKRELKEYLENNFLDLSDCNLE